MKRIYKVYKKTVSIVNDGDVRESGRKQKGISAREL